MGRHYLAPSYRTPLGVWHYLFKTLDSVYGHQALQQLWRLFPILTVSGFLLWRLYSLLGWLEWLHTTQARAAVACSSDTGRISGRVKVSTSPSESSVPSQGPPLFFLSSSMWHGLAQGREPLGSQAAGWGTRRPSPASEKQEHSEDGDHRDSPCRKLSALS